MPCSRISAQVRGGVRDRVFAILALGVFVVFFWAAFEQAGNVLNVWADQQTDRYLTEEPRPPVVKPGVPKAEVKTEAGRRYGCSSVSAKPASRSDH